jgi:hypothetical protein
MLVYQRVTTTPLIRIEENETIDLPFIKLYPAYPGACFVFRV